MEAPGVMRDDIVTTDALSRRSGRPRDLNSENASLRRLMHEIPRAAAPLSAAASMSAFCPMCSSVSIRPIPRPDAASGAWGGGLSSPGRFAAHLGKPVAGARLVASSTSLLEDPATRPIRIVEER
jgi:hypothetical protein